MDRRLSWEEEKKFEEWVVTVADEIRKLADSEVLNEMRRGEVFEAFLPREVYTDDQIVAFYWRSISSNTKPKVTAFEMFSTTLRRAQTSYLEKLGLEDFIK